MIHFLLPLRTQPSPERSTFVRSAAASDPASDSDKQYEKPSPLAKRGSQRFFCSSLPPSSKGTEPSLFTAGMSDEDPHTRATSSIMITAASASAPSPPNSVGTCAAYKPFFTSAAFASLGKRCSSSTACANGAISFSASARTLVRSSLYSAGKSNTLSIRALSCRAVLTLVNTDCSLLNHLADP